VETYSVLILRPHNGVSLFTPAAEAAWTYLRLAALHHLRGIDVDRLNPIDSTLPREAVAAASAAKAAAATDEARAHMFEYAKLAEAYNVKLCT